MTVTENDTLAHNAEDSQKDVEKSYANAHAEIANLYQQASENYAQGQYTQARDKAMTALELSREIGTGDMEAECLDLVGGAHFELGDLDRAYVCHKRALFICQEATDGVCEAHNLWHLGRITRKLGRSQEALHYLESSLQLYHSLGDPLGQADALNELGNLIWDYRKRRDYYEQALNLVNIYGDAYRQARANNNLAVTYWELGLYTQALAYTKPAVQLGHEMKSQESLCHTLETLGRIGIR